MDTSHWPRMPKQKRQRLMFTATYLETGSAAAAAKVSGLSSPHARHRIAQHIQEHGTLDEAPHHRSPTKFTSSVFQAATDYLLGLEAKPTCTPEVIAHLEREQLLQPPTNAHNFLAHWSAWLADQGLTLQHGSRAMIFDISETSEQRRLKWVKQVRAELGVDFQLSDIIFVDETTFEESPHPKGDCTNLTPRRIWCNPAAALGWQRSATYPCAAVPLLFALEAVLFHACMAACSCLLHSCLQGRRQACLT